jgi:hypothetical protein
VNLDQTTLIWCVLVPAVITAMAAVVSIRHQGVCAAGCASLGWWVAVTTSLVAIQGWQWWPEDSWRQAIWPLLSWSLLLAGTAAILTHDGFRWTVAGLLAIVTAMIAMPSGEGWQDTLPLHRHWMALIAGSCLVNAFAVERLSRAGGHRWSLLVATAGLAGPLALAASTYASLAQWAVSMVVATVVFAILGFKADVRSGLWTAAIPAVVGAAVITATARFYSYQSHPGWVYAIALFLPAMVSTFDLPFRSRPDWARILVSGLIAVAMVAVCVWKVLLS